MHTIVRESRGGVGAEECGRFLSEVEVTLLMELTRRCTRGYSREKGSGQVYCLVKTWSRAASNPMCLRSGDSCLGPFVPYMIGCRAWRASASYRLLFSLENGIRAFVLNLTHQQGLGGTPRSVSLPLGRRDFNVFLPLNGTWAVCGDFFCARVGVFGRILVFSHIWPREKGGADGAVCRWSGCQEDARRVEGDGWC